MKWAFPLLSAALLSSLVSGQIQIKTAADGPKRDAIKADFQQNWSAYLKYASPMDKLQPVSMKGANDPNYARMSGTIVDALSTLITMGMANTKEWDDLMEIIKKIDFTTTREDGFGEAGEVSVFEMTVR
jgi:mannosyl-oligosaccharide alpha-1,2-mannosidase